MMKPIDAQIMVNRSSEFSRYQSDMNNRSDMASHIQSQHVQHNAENKVKNVEDKENAQKALVREKQEKSGHQEKKKKDSKENKKDKELLNEEHHKIDIRL